MKQDVYDGTVAGRTRTEDRPASQRGGSDVQELMKKAEAPGPGHKALEHYVGNWQCDVKCWMEPGGQPNVSQGRAQARWIMNGRFLEEEFQGEMMGRPFRGRTVMGHDNAKQSFQSTWISDMQTSTFISEGKGDASSITLDGKSSCAATGRKDIPMRVVLRVISPDKHTFEMFDGSQGNAKTMEITYTRL